MNPYQETFKTWNKVAELYEQKFMEDMSYCRTYDAFLDLLPKADSNVLEIGCGPGNISRYLLNKSAIQLLGIDISKNMIELARKNVPNAYFKELDARAIDSLERHFEGILAGFCLPYISHQDSLTLFNNCYDILTHKGVLFLSYIEGDKNKSHFITGSYPSDDRMFIYYYDTDELIITLKGVGFKHLKTYTHQFNRSETEETHSTLILQKELKTKKV